jgi:hypothetical protein
VRTTIASGLRAVVFGVAVMIAAVISHASPPQGDPGFLEDVTWSANASYETFPRGGRCKAAVLGFGERRHHGSHGRRQRLDRGLCPGGCRSGAAPGGLRERLRRNPLNIPRDTMLMRPALAAAILAVLAVAVKSTRISAAPDSLHWRLN